MEELVKLIDEHTEYFRSHLEVLGKTERRVYVAVIDLWQASNTGEIAARARMDVRIVSTMLGRLVGRGAVIVEGSGKKRLYSAERLYSIYYKLRRERDEAAIVENLIRFMAVFYSEAELAEMFGKLHAEADQSKVIHEGKTWMQALDAANQKKLQNAMNDLRSVYAMFDSDKEVMMHETLRLVPDLIVAGASEHDLVQILSSDKTKSDALLPLVVALRQRIGEKVRAPAEVLEVAADIRERIEEKRPR